MDNKKILGSIYDDFFGTVELNTESEQISQQNTTVENKEFNILDEFQKIDDLYITEESKKILKKILEYIRKYSEKQEKHFIPFNMCIYSDNEETTEEITQIIHNAVTKFSYVKKGNINENSIYNIENIEQLQNTYKSTNSVIVLNDFSVLNSKEQEFRDKFFHKLEEIITNNQQEFFTIIVSSSKELMNQVFVKNEELKQTIFELEITSTSPDVQYVYQTILEKLQENNEISEEFQTSLLDYIANTYPKTDLSYPEYRDNLYQKILFNKDTKISKEALPKYEKEKTMDEIFEELNSLVGLEKVKQALQDLVNLIELKKKTNDILKMQDVNLHMVFLGNPGTGKTTVARLISGILYNLGYIEQNKLIEVSSKDLVAEYVGQTGPKTMSVVEKALGGVLFIDEAYSLAEGIGSGNSYNAEAIATLIQAMENNRDNLVVIFAGYTKEMQSFLNANSGIVSRIGYTLEFEDYTEQQLLQIFNSMIKKAGFEITKSAEEKVLKIIGEYKNTKNFGNARFARNLYEKTVIKHASNTKGKKSKKILRTIEEQDISTENLLKM